MTFRVTFRVTLMIFLVYFLILRNYYLNIKNPVTKRFLNDFCLVTGLLFLCGRQDLNLSDFHFIPPILRRSQKPCDLSCDLCLLSG